MDAQPTILSLLAPGLGAFVGGLMVALTTAGVVHRYTKISNGVETTLNLSKRYQELFTARLVLNKKFEAQKNVAETIKEADRLGKLDAQDWYRQYFDLLLNEYRFYQKRIVDRRDFVQWMRWARDAYSLNYLVCGVSYREGWHWWHAAADRWSIMRWEPVVGLLIAVHDPSGRAVEDLVRVNYTPPFTYPHDE